MPSQLPRRKQLEEELIALGDQAMLIEEFDGFVAGLLVCPDLISPNEWLPIVLGEGENNSVFDDLDHANRVFGLIMDHYNDVALTLTQQPERYRPLFPIDQRNGDVLWELWIEGFAESVGLRPAAWEKLPDADDDAAAVAAAGMLMLIDVARGGQDLTQEEVDKLNSAAPGMIPRWVVTLNSRRIGNSLPPSALEQSPAPPPPAWGRKIGRNEPCPCGSGKKYKKCCGKN